MAFIPVNTTVQVEMVHGGPGGVAVNVHHVKVDHAIALADLTAIGLCFKDWFDVDCKSQVSSGVALNLIRLRDLSTQAGLVLDYQTALPIAGTRVSPGMPSNVTLALTGRTGFAGRSFRSRTYWIGLCEDQCTGDAIVGAIITSLLAIMNALITRVAAIGADYELVVVSKYTNNAPRANGITTPIQAFTTDGVIDSQRRRLLGRGA